MAVLTQRNTSATAKNGSSGDEANGSTTSNGTSRPPLGTSSSNEDLKGKVTTKAGSNSKGKSLQERGQIPSSFFVTFGTIFGLEYFSGMWTKDIFTKYYNSITFASESLKNAIIYAYHVILNNNNTGMDHNNSNDYMRTIAITAACIFLLYIFFIAPSRAGFWTGRRAKRHKFHRYMGLCYMIHYILAWTEFFTDHNKARYSYLIHLCAVNGVLQGTSAYFSFKVLPELNDPGYYSDRAVLSRTFVHENIFFTIMCVFGSIYYNEEARTMLRTNYGGKFIEMIYIFWPYVLVRTWYPRTRFSHSGQTYKGRSDKNMRFYEIGTFTVKIFYLWAKYFLGYFINFAIYLNIVNEKHWPMINGMLLLNAGTVSLSVFLHTMRFKKVFPAKFAFCLYLIQIYLSFLAIPTAYEMFKAHPKLCAVCMTGLVANATRSRTLHGVWCAVAMFLMTQMDIKW